MLNIKEIDSINIFKYKYSICTLVTDFNEYEIMKESFFKSGFNKKNSEFIFINNENNKYDAYTGINKLISSSLGEYIIICHQDIELNYDNEGSLSYLIDELNQIDNDWAIAGNVGGKSLGELVIRISDPHGTNISVGVFPEKVKSLDENFLILKKSANLGLSRNLSGFHLYGTDICKLAEIRGYSAYVINFHLLHKSPGNVNSDFVESRKNFIDKYQRALSSDIIQTTCTAMFLSSSRLINMLFSEKNLTKVRRLLRRKKKRI